MILKFEGKLKKILPQQSGISQKGNEWKKDSYLFESIESDDKYKKEVLVESLNRTFPLEEGEKYTIGIEPESREFNGRWYSTIRFVGLLNAEGKLIKDDDYKQAPSAGQEPQDQANTNGEEEGTELPF